MACAQSLNEQGNPHSRRNRCGRRRWPGRPRHRARVLLIERYGFLGGLASAGLVVPILGYTASQSNIPIVEGLLKELTERMHKLGGAPTFDESCQE
ncbi:MAG: FAD-dependent oxidoreductase [Anaerolineae bacterium]|nr:FAD-dependent oxidoreductase [Anaerolineae bacterium]